MDRRILCASVLTASLLVGGGAFAQQEQPGSATDSGAQPQQQSTDTGGAQQQSSQSASGAQQGQQGQQATANDPDKQFLKSCAVANMAEMKLAQAAQDKAQSQDVKQLAQTIMQDHQQMQQQLQQTAQKAGVQLPQDLPQQMQEQVQTISQLQGDQFDKHFVSAVKATHAAALSKFGDEAKIAQNDDVKQFASQQLPTLQAHGQKIQSIAMAQGLSTEGLGQAQPAGATIQPSQQQQQPGQSGGTTSTPNASSPDQQQKSDTSR
jgi:putative membrane protein